MRPISPSWILSEKPDSRWPNLRDLILNPMPTLGIRTKKTAVEMKAKIITREVETKRRLLSIS